MKQPEKGGRYVYDPKTGNLTKVERDRVKASASDATTENLPTAEQPSSAARRGK